MTEPALCSQCQSPLREGARFCSKCGAKIEATVPAEKNADSVSDMPTLIVPEDLPVPQPSENQKKAEDSPKTPSLPTMARRSSMPDSQPHLTIREGSNETTIPLTGQQLIIGRDPNADLAIGLPGPQNPVGLPGISRQHARIFPVNDGYAIEDMGSRNGTYLRGRQIPPHQVIPLQYNDVIRIGDIYGNSVSLTYAVSAAHSQILASVIPIDIGHISNLKTAVIGRDPQSDIPLSSSGISWKHARLVKTASGHDLTDLKSTNGTFVNGKRIQRIALKPGDIIQIGPYKMEYGKGTMVAEAQNLRVDGIHLVREVPSGSGKKTILNDISLTILPREFVALVGGSGAGKSTLMDALNGSRPANKGHVLINGDDLYQHYDTYRGDMGYVPQADILHTTLPVKLALSYTAQLRLPPDTSKQEIQKRIDDVLEIVEMTEQKDLHINQLSGGQRKRISIASEMLSEPRLLFLDEPTSGLDPGLDKKMMRTLNNLADSGCTIMLTTHATSNILDMCDHVVFLSYGRLVYFGPPQKAMNFYRTPDFSTIYAKVDTRQEAIEAEASYMQSPDYQEYVTNRQAEIPVIQQQASAKIHTKPKEALKTSLRQFSIFTRRYFDLILNDKMSLFVLCAAMPIIGVLLLLIANPRSLTGNTESEIWHIARRTGAYTIVPDTQRLLFMLALAAILLGLFASAYEIIKERVVYERERMINLKIIPYILSKTAVLMAFGLVQCLLLLIVTGFKVTYPSKGIFTGPFLEMYITLILAMFSSVGIGLLISAISKSNNSVIYIILVVLFVQIIFSGAIFNLPSAASYISYLTPTRWAFEALGASVNINRLNQLGKVYFSDFNQMVRTHSTFEVNFASTFSHLLTNWGILFLFGAVAILLTILILRSQDRRKI